MSAHTPGPWTYEIVPYDEQERSLPKSEWSGVYVGPEGDEPPGHLLHTIFEGGFTHGQLDGDPEADARLIAAAPELLSALKTCRCPRPARGRPDDDTVGECFAAGVCGCDCGTALAKAGGQSAINDDINAMWEMEE